MRHLTCLWSKFQVFQCFRICFIITFGRVCNINAIYNIFPDGDSNSNPQNSSQADKYLTNMAVTDPTKERDTVRLLLKRSCLSPGGTRHQPCQYKPAPVQKSTQYPGHVPGGAERTCFVNSLNSFVHRIFGFFWWGFKIQPLLTFFGIQHWQIPNFEISVLKNLIFNDFAAKTNKFFAFSLRIGR